MYLFIWNIVAAIELAGYEWYLVNIVNNGNGGWPLALGSDRFKPENFDMAEVAGRSSTLSLSKKSLLSKKTFISTNESVNLLINYFLGMARRKYAQAIIVVSDVYADIKDVSKNVLYVRILTRSFTTKQITTI